MRVAQNLEKATAERTAGAGDRDAGIDSWNSNDRRDNRASEMAAQDVAPDAVQAQYGAKVFNAKYPPLRRGHDSRCSQGPQGSDPLDGCAARAWGARTMSTANQVLAPDDQRVNIWSLLDPVRLAHRPTVWL